MENIFIDELIKKTEFTKILNNISNFSLSEKGKKEIFNIKPEFNYSEIENQLKILKEVKNFFLYEKIELINFSNNNENLKKIEKRILIDPVELYNIAISIKLYIYLKTRIDKKKYPLFSNLFTIENNNNLLFYQKILKYIDQKGYISSSASLNLKKIRDNITFLESKIKKVSLDFYNELKLKNWSVLDDICYKDNFPCVAIKSSYKNYIDGIVIDSSNSGQTSYIIPSKVIELHNELIIEKNNEQEEIKKIIKEYCDEIYNNLHDINTIDQELLNFDIIYSKTKYAIINNLNYPEISQQKIIKIINGKHPLLGDKCVPLNLEIGNNYNIIIITGPNAGGKTVVLKSVGLFCLCFQSLIPINVSENSIFTVFDNIFIDIGDQQSIEQSISTFSGHIKNIVSILENINSNSLVLLDELGTGTDPEEGTALAISIIQYLKQIDCLALITSHFNGLKYFAYQETKVINSSMEFDIERNQPTYKLKIGVCGESHAFEISEKLGLNKDIINNAKKLINKNYLNLEQIIDNLNQEKKLLELKESEYKQKIDEINKLKEQLEIEKINIKEKEKELNNLIKNQKKDFLSEKRKEFENIIKKIKEENASKQSIIEGKNFLKDLEITNENNITNDHDKINTNFNIGDHVFIKSKQTNGVILSKTNNEDQYLVQAGIIKIKVNKNDLEIIKEKKQNIKKENINFSYESSSKKIVLDLRGYRIEEAEKKIDKFIEEAISNKFKEIRIIHGLGTGALKNFIRNFLKESPFIESFDYEKEIDKPVNYGVTVAKIKLK